MTATWMWYYLITIQSGLLHMSKSAKRLGRVTQLYQQQPEKIEGKTENQKRLIEAIFHNDIVISTGYPGTGKTYLTASLAADWYADMNNRQIIITRPMVANGEEIGHLPGTETEKSTPWAHAPLDVIRRRIGDNKYNCDLGKNIIVKPLQMLQGASFDNAWVLVDEAQEMTISQAKMIVTRIGEGSKLLINGDTRQQNLKGDSGLVYLINLFKDKKVDVPVIEFGMGDCQRSGLCRKMIEAIYA